MSGAPIRQLGAAVLTYDLTPHCVAVGGVELTQIQTLVWREKTKEIHDTVSLYPLGIRGRHKLRLTSCVF